MASEATVIEENSISVNRHKLSPKFTSNLRKMLEANRVARLRSEFIAVIGADCTGRNTLVRRFLHMSEGPFVEEESQKHKRRTVLVDLSNRPNFNRKEVVKLEFYILNPRSHTQKDFQQHTPELKSIALVFDVRYERTLNIAISTMYRIHQLLSAPPPPFIVIGNKIDLENATRSIRRRARDCGAENYYECSALMDTNMDPVLDAILILTFFPGRRIPR